MGTDIHIWMEYRRPGHLWRLVKQTVCGRCDGGGRVLERVKREDDNYEQVEEDCWYCEGQGLSKLVKEDRGGWNGEGQVYYGGRSYAMFAALAGVRSGQRNLIDPRGVPDDASDIYKELVAQEDSDGHTHSYLDLDDIIAIHLFEEGSLDGPVDSYADEEIVAKLSGQSSRMYSFFETFELMQKIAAKLGPSNVRVVFFFDN